MIKKILQIALFSIAVTPSCVSWAALIPGSSASGEARIRVRLAEALPVVTVRGYDLQIFDTLQTGAGRKLAYAPPQSSEWEIRCQGGRIRALSTRGAKSLDLSGPITISTPAGLLSFRNHPYRDELRIYPMGSFCEVVNELGVEKYLAGLVNSEFNSKWNESATEAQVVAARTYAIYQVRAARKAFLNGVEQHYDLDSTVRDQVYDGYLKEDYRGSLAVQKTRGLVLTASAAGSGYGELLKAFYHSTCAGRTELPQQVWGNSFPGFKHSVSCPFCAHSPRISWELEVSAPEVAKLFLQGARADGAPLSWPPQWQRFLRSGKLLAVHAGVQTPSFRRSEVSTFWKTPDGQSTELRVSAVTFRNWLGVARFRSTAFDVVGSQASRGDLSWRFRGRGNGHGVGLCQWGAKTMGERGYSMQAILRFYYPDAVLRKLW